jgi:hypothetical protein
MTMTGDSDLFQEPQRNIPYDEWRTRFEEIRARLSESVDGTDDSDDIEAEIALALAEVRAEHAARHSS